MTRARLSWRRAALVAVVALAPVAIVVGLSVLALAAVFESTSADPFEALGLGVLLLAGVYLLVGPLLLRAVAARFGGALSGGESFAALLVAPFGALFPAAGLTAIGDRGDAFYVLVQVFATTVVVTLLVRLMARVPDAVA